MVSIDEFKRAFAGQAADDGLKERDNKVKEALKRLSAAVGKTARADGLKAATKKLVERYAATQDKSGGPATDSAAELDRILRQAQAVVGRIETTPVGAPPPPAGAPSPPTSTGPAPVPPTPTPQRPPKNRTVRTKVKIVADFDTLRNAVIEWAERTVSRSRATLLVNASNLRDIHEDAVAKNLIGAEILADLKAGAGGIASVEFKRDPKFQQKWWEPTDKDYLPMIYEVFDARTGKPIKGAKVRFPSGNAYVTDAEGRVKTQVLASKVASKPLGLEVSATGYVNTEKSVQARSGRLEGGARLDPIDPKKADEVMVSIEVRDGTEGKPVPQAKVTIGRVSEATDKNGIVLIPLVPGVHSFSVKATGYHKETGRIDVRDMLDEKAKTIGPLTQSILIKPIGGDDVVLRVLDSNTKKPIAKAGVRLSTQAEETDTHGEATFLSIPFGEHRLWAEAKGYAPHDRFLNHNQKSAADFHIVELDPN